MVFSDLVEAEWPIHIQETSLAPGIAEPPLHGPEIGGSGKDVHARIATATNGRVGFDISASQSFIFPYILALPGEHRHIAYLHVADGDGWNAGGSE